MSSTKSLILLISIFLLASSPACAINRKKFRSSLNASNLSPKRMRQRRRCLRHLIEARNDLKCALLLISLPKRLAAARRCTYNGLPFSEYRIIRAVCRQRSEVLAKISTAHRLCQAKKSSVRYSKKEKKESRDDSGSPDIIPPGFDVRPTCNNLNRLRKLRIKTLQACDEIGWDGDRDVCPKILPLKDKLKYIMWKGCGADGIEAARREFRRIRKRCDRVSGIVNPIPSNSARAAP